ncbi:hypothetical protein M405DRAFT_835340 [Rhizopogon salebrosus TDB-379]|nr:hypothetical protein M405DRAFT_835340 [Rhizopogon salebrosus TDB-379]
MSVEDVMLCKNEGRGDPGQCLKEGRRVTRCATDLINKMRENCLEQFDTLELSRVEQPGIFCVQKT